MSGQSFSRYLVASKIALLGGVAVSPALAQTAVELPEINVAAQSRQTAPENAASEQFRSADRITEKPFSRPGEVLETVPGLVITQHSGEGKANQYFLRGFNLDHGTDLAITVDGMPVNMRTHGHGQGWADINFLIPELVQSMRIRKGPYFAEEGDFSSAGSLHIDYADTFNPGLAQITAGSFGYGRLLAIKSLPVWAGNILVAAEATKYDGPWDHPDDVKKFNGVLRYSAGTADDGYSVTAMAYDNQWNSTDQIPQRAVTQGLITRWGSIDPSDGGKTDRYSLSGRIANTNDYGVTRAEAYVVRSNMDLWSNFSYFLNNPIDGDQFKQFDYRTMAGLNASHTMQGTIATRPSEFQFGIQSRYDDINLGLLNTQRRTTLSTVRNDDVQEGSVGLYAQNTTYWTDWLRTIAGIRGDWYRADVDSNTPANSGNDTDFIGSPKIGVVFGPFHKHEIFVNAGTGFHSNDVRGTTITVNPPNAPGAGLPAQQVPMLVRSTGAEVGFRTKAIDGLESAVSLFVLEFESELVFVGDAGTTEASRPSRRVGIEWTNYYKVNSWLAFDGDFAITRARFIDADPAGNFIPGSPTMVGTLGVVVGGQQPGWYGTAKLRYFGERPLIEDDTVRSGSTTVVNASVGYLWANGMRAQLEVFNLFNAEASQIDYFYESRLRGEPAAGFSDIHFHPLEPFAARLTLAARF